MYICSWGTRLASDESQAIGGSSSQARVYLDAGIKVARDCGVVFLSDGTATMAVTDVFEPT